MKSVEHYVRLANENRDAANWYDQAAREIREVCRIAGWNVQKFTGILAVTSPRVSVARNLRITLHYLDTGEFLDNVMVGVRAGVKHFEKTGEIRGPKTSAFFRALLGDTTAVVLDVHMASLFGVSQLEFAKPARYTEFVRVVNVIADSARLHPRDCQAALWSARLRARGRKPARLNIALERSNQKTQRGFKSSGAIRQLGDISGRVWKQLF